MGREGKREIKGREGKGRGGEEKGGEEKRTATVARDPKQGGQMGQEQGAQGGLPER